MSIPFPSDDVTFFARYVLAGFLIFLSLGAGYVINTRNDGTTINGYYGKDSRAGRDSGRSEIYAQRLYVVGSDGQWTEAKPPRAALVSLNGLRSIAFLES